MPRDQRPCEPSTRQPAPEETGRSPRDPRRIWARLLPRQQAFRHPYARFLVDWSAAILFAETFAAWQAAHPDAGGGPAELRR